MLGSVWFRWVWLRWVKLNLNFKGESEMKWIKLKIFRLKKFLYLKGVIGANWKTITFIIKGKEGSSLIMNKFREKSRQCSVPRCGTILL